ncbi:DNA polymerase IV [Endozoicomonas montiporae]|uniref:DNA polymerase IV n=1 Tax=Endozoicomonas montiporae TaxID=1027273 RepID=A0A081NBF8_9GAMM|nr:DNA polymerase IV [Endozoicomonas montiporae]
MSSTSLPDEQRKILHVDADAFYCSVEEREDPSLKGKAFAVGGRPERRGVIATCSYTARASGVRSAMASFQAVRLCPELKIIPPRFDVYQEASKKMHDIFHRYTSLIEPLSLDEAYLDVTGVELCKGSATLMAREIMQAVRDEIGITVSVGAAPNKFLAKIASDWNKPNGLFVIPPADIEDFVFELPVERIHGVGKVTTEKMHNKGIFTCGQLRQYSPLELCRWFGTFGERLWEMARGVDDRPVETGRRRKSLSVEHTYDTDLMDEAAIVSKVKPLFDDLSRRFSDISSEYAVQKRFVKVKFADFSQTTLEEILDRDDLDAQSHFTTLMIRAWERGKKPVRLLGLGVRLIDLRAPEQFLQLELFERKRSRV